jgi:hypothetical protein
VSKVQTLYAPPKSGQRIAALYVVIRSNLPECAKRVFSVLVWHANHNIGRCDPSHSLLAKGANITKRSVITGVEALLKEGFITILRKPKLHRPTAYQIQWELLSEIQRRWEKTYGEVMAARRKAHGGKAAELRTYRSSDVILGVKGRSPQGCKVFHPEPAPKGCKVFHPNPIEPYEVNPMKEDARSGEPRPETGSPSLTENQEEVSKGKEVAGPANQLIPDQVANHERIAALARWGKAAKRKPWTKPTILSDEPRDLSEFPVDDMAA